jgi:adenine-specific DNA-methyltransferase
VWYTRSVRSAKFRQLYFSKILGGQGTGEYVRAKLRDGTERPLTKEERSGEQEVSAEIRVFRQDSMVSQGAGASGEASLEVFGKPHHPGTTSHWKTHPKGVINLAKADRVLSSGRVLKYKRFIDDFPIFPIVNNWRDTGTGGSSSDPRIYVVQTVAKVVERCILMTTDPCDLVLDPTCGSGTTATVAEQWGRRWITIDTSRVALALARARIMGARYPFYLLADSREGQLKEAEVTRTAPSSQPVHGNIRHGFVYERVPQITLKSIANNAEINVIWDKWCAIRDLGENSGLRAASLVS